MDIRNRRAVRSAASEALAANPGDPRMVVLAYIAITAGSSLLVSVLINLLGERINETGGLADLGLRSILSTIQTCLPLAQTVVLWYVQLGYQKATVRMARRQAVAPRDLAEGFSYFGPLLRAVLLQGGIYLMMGFITVQVASIIFMLTPFSAEFIELVLPMASDPDAFYNALYTDAQLYARVGMALLPMIPIWLVLFGLLAAPFFYSCRMVNYVLLERRGTGALAAMGESARMMRGNRMALLKLDLSYWWFYLAQILLTAVLYGDMLLPRLGVTLPWSATVSYYVFSVAYLVLQGVLFYFFMNRVEATYATAYDALRPRPRENQGGVVLGNIFDLARDYKQD
ncbi:MAG: DUF975 family protein [Oscillospiraceae bacterium]|nr:DUF975 family protein [Oscillospiraceae bacterium]